MVWWVAAGVVAVSLVALALVVGALRSRLAELDRVMALAKERADQAQRRVQTSMAPLPATLAGLQRRTTALNQRLSRLTGNQ